MGKREGKSKNDSNFLNLIACEPNLSLHSQHHYRDWSGWNLWSSLFSHRYEINSALQACGYFEAPEIGRNKKLKKTEKIELFLDDSSIRVHLHRNFYSCDCLYDHAVLYPS